MVNEDIYYGTAHTFISPIRHFKANDPYYYEIDNIPIKQLEESQKFLKDQVDGIILRQRNQPDIEIDRSGFSELKPYATGNNRKVKVKPGRYTTRVNDAYSIKPLQLITQTLGYSNALNSNNEVAETTAYRVDTILGSTAASVLEDFRTGATVMNMNGLAERSFVFPVWDEDGFHLERNPLNRGTSGTPGYASFNENYEPDDRATYPNYIGSIYRNNTQIETRDLQLIAGVYNPDRDPSGRSQGRLESEFIRAYRGVFRTAIVDVPDELEITIPDFDPDEFYIIDESGNKQNISNPQRIDLLFIYSKAVDQSQTTIPSFKVDGSPKTILKPQLGIVKGAGVGLSLKGPGPLSPTQSSTWDESKADDLVSLVDSSGYPIMISHRGDSFDVNGGFNVSSTATDGTVFIRGSFPSPDDLMNLAPLISTQLESDAYQLIGQSILPIAYIRVQSDNGPIVDLITNDDIIDIRPFFRGTELTYNERAGIAASLPQLSLANPVVSLAHLDKVKRETISHFDERIGAVEGAIGGIEGPGNATRVIAAGDVLGGVGFGPEGALMKQLKETGAGNVLLAPMNTLADEVEDNFNYVPGSIGYLPQWDKALWKSTLDPAEVEGSKPCDHINICLPRAAEFRSGTNSGGFNRESLMSRFLPPWRGAEAFDESINELQSKYPDKYTLSMFGWGPKIPNNPYRASLTGTNVNGQPITIVGNAGQIGRDLGQDFLNEINSRMIQINFVRKIIKLDLSLTPWVKDYHVNVSLLNCVPLSESFKFEESEDNKYMGRNANHIWVNKYKNYFIINVAWAGTNCSMNKAEENGYLPWMPQNRNNPEMFAGFALPTPLQLGSNSFGNYPARQAGTNSLASYNKTSTQINDFYNQLIAGDPAVGSGSRAFVGAVPILYPSVTYEVIGISESSRGDTHGSLGDLMNSYRPTVICR